MTLKKDWESTSILYPTQSLNLISKIFFSWKISYHMFYLNSDKIMKKNKSIHLFSENRGKMPKLLLIMKISCLLSFLCVLQVSATVYSQNTLFNLDIKNVTIREALKTIESKSEFRFFYNDDFATLDKKIDLNVHQKKLDAILGKIFADANITYKIMEDNVVVIFPTSELQQIVTGTVTDMSTGEPLPGVNIIIKGTSTGVITNTEGKFSIDVPGSDAILVFSYVGYLPEEVSVGNQSVINVSLSPNIKLLDEIVVIGYGTSKVKDLTSSITTVKSDEISKTPSGQTMQSLQGKVAGLQVIGTGEPGTSPTIRIRGVGSYPKADANNHLISPETPLYVVDGMFFDNIDFLSPSDIASISVLKDASAAAIYGVRAANGVILIETKSGSFNQKAKITYDGYYGVQVAENVLKMANANEFSTYIREAGGTDADNILQAMQRFGRSRVNPNVPDVNTDWYKEILRPANIQNHSFNISGGTEKASYALGTSYFYQEGIMNMKNDYNRFNFHSRIDYKATDWLNAGGNFIFSNGIQYLDQKSAWNLAYFAVPILPVYDELNTNATPIDYADATYIGYRSGQNPFPTMEFNQDRYNTIKMLGNFYTEVHLIPKKLTFKTTFNQSFISRNRREVNLPYFLSVNNQTVNSKVKKTSSQDYNKIWDNILTYNDNFGKHNLVVMAGSEYRDEMYNELVASGLNFPTNSEQTWYISQSASILSSDVTDDGTRYYGLSYFGRLSYNYDNKYLLYGTMRADGSSKYQQKWGYFPTVGVGWVLSEENFLKNNNIINFLKLRGSWGQLGNDQIQASDGANTTQSVQTAINGAEVSGTITTNTFSSLKWEVSEETNVGITANILNNRLSIDGDYYIRKTKNAAIPTSIPVVGGTVLKNVGIIQNTGVELSMNWSDKIGDFQYNIGGNFSTLKNQVKDLYGQPYLDGGQAEFLQRSMVGEPILSFYGYKVVGVYQTAQEIVSDPVAQATMTASNGGIILEPGDLKFADTNGDGQITPDDRVILGSYIPTFMYGFNLGLSYKNLDFSASMYGQSGNKILNRKRGEVIWTDDQNIDADLAINRWHGDGTSNEYPSSAGLRKGWNQRMSSFFVEDGAFFRIQNVQLTYTIKEKQIFGVQIPEVKISLTAYRPLTIFKYNGFNPELADGIDTQTYPVPAVYSVGLNVKF